jgi:NADH-quinone oxidoreductase subunit L
MVGVFLTSLYTFRLLFLVFGDRARTGRPERQSEAHEAHNAPGMEAPLRIISTMGLPLAILAALCAFGGLLDFPRFLGGIPLIKRFLGTVLPGSGVLSETVASSAASFGGGEALLSALSIAVTLLGIPFAWMLARASGRAVAAGQEPSRQEPRLAAFFRGGWGFDTAYEFLIQRPFEWVAHINRRDIVNVLSDGLGELNLWFSSILSRSQTGRIRLYVAALALGAALIVAAAVIL